MTSAFKFLAAGAVSPFTGFRWPAAGAWVSAGGEEEASWIYACRARDLPYWVDTELWRIELGGPVREAPFQILAPRARLAEAVDAWNDQLRERYAHACIMRARELVLPVLPPDLRQRIERTEDPVEVGAAVRASSASFGIAGYLGDAAAWLKNPAAVSHVACVVAASLGEGEQAFEAERAWQARWLSEHLGLEGG